MSTVCTDPVCTEGGYKQYVEYRGWVLIDVNSMYRPCLYIIRVQRVQWVLIDVNSMYRPCLYIIRVQRVGTTRCQQYVATLFVDNNGTEGGY